MPRVEDGVLNGEDGQGIAVCSVLLACRCPCIARYSDDLNGLCIGVQCTGWASYFDVILVSFLPRCSTSSISSPAVERRSQI